MLRLGFECTDCGYSEDNFDVKDEWMLVGQCPSCGNHHGNMIYMTDMKIGEFVEELAKMDEDVIAKSSLAVKIIAECLVEDGETK